MKNRISIGAELNTLKRLLGSGKLTSREFARHMNIIKIERDTRLGIAPLSAKDLVPPFTIKTVQCSSLATPKMRAEELKRTGYNVFRVRAETISIDLLTDSGTGAPSDEMMAEIMRADERYAHSITYEYFVKIASRIFNKKFIQPVHQGRAAENIAFSVLLKNLVEDAQKTGRSIVCTGNTYFDTTFANATRMGARVINATCAESEKTDESHPFKGNADVGQIKEIIKKHGPENVGFIIMTVVNNSIGGQPVSLENLKSVHKLAKEHNILLILDSARIFENAYLIKQREEKYSNYSIADIVHEMTGLADIVLMSCKKDAIANMGGLIATDDENLYNLFSSLGILIEGHYSYGGMSGRDLGALTRGLEEGMDENYLRHRINQVTEFGNGFRRLGFPIQWPPGSNGIYLDARRFLSHIDKIFFPAQRLCAEIYQRYGIRPVEIGLSLAGRGVDGIKIIPPVDFVRFTIPRRVLGGEHFAFMLEALADLYDDKENIGGLVYDKEGLGNGHFTSTFKPIFPGQMEGLRDSTLEYFNTPFMTFERPYFPPNATGSF